MYVHQIEEKAGEVNTEEEIKVLKFRIYVSNDENAIDVVQNWKNNGQLCRARGLEMSWRLSSQLGNATHSVDSR